MYYFRKVDVPGLKSYSYKSIDKSFVANRILNPYWWSVIIDFVPSWVAPNLITLTGFLCVLANVALLFYVSPDLKEACPPWAYISFAVGLFVYQSLDAIDGKQARRTGSSGPLGELFDHGCDALNTGFATFLGMNALGLTQSWWQIFGVYSCLANFYLSTWEEYYTGVLYLSECSGPVEGVLTMCAILITTSFYGPELWSKTLGQLLPEKLADLISSYPFLADLPLNQGFIYFGLFIVIPNVVGSIINVYSAIATNPASAEKAKKFSPILALLPFPIVTCITVTYPFLFPSLIVSSPAIAPFLIIVSFLMGQQVGSIIVAHISKRVYPFLEMVLPGLAISATGLGLAVARAFIVAGTSREKVVWEEFEMTAEILWGVAVGCGVMYLVWFIRIVADLCEVFDIYCLSIKHQKVVVETPNAVKGKGGKRSSSKNARMIVGMKVGQLDHRRVNNGI